MRRVLAVLLASAFTQSALAQEVRDVPRSPEWPITGMRVRLGASVDAVRSAYGLRDASLVIMKPGEKFLRDAQSGLTFYFFRSECLAIISLERKSAGTVVDVAVGDAWAPVRSRLGLPLIEWRWPLRDGPNTKYRYDPTRDLTVVYEVSANNILVGILVMPLAPGDALDVRCVATS